MLILPGFDLANAINLATLLAGSDGGAAMTWGKSYKTPTLSPSRRKLTPLLHTELH